MEYTDQGRWSGRLTNRPLPMDDAQIDRLTDNQRLELAHVWLARAASERRVADAFEVIRDAFRELDGDPALSALSARAIDDELRHAELSRRVASRYAGRELAEPERLRLVVPEHPGASPRLLRTLHVLGHCAMNETFASAYLEAGLLYADAALARAALRALFSDEIDHARLGWAHLAGLSVNERAELAPWLPALVRANLKMWRDAPRPYPADPMLHAHGAPPTEAVECALLDAVRLLIIPGLAHFGLPVDPIRDWLERGAPTGSPA